MTLRCYVPKKFQTETLKVIKTANQILEDYAAQGFSMTLRQLYYQFVSRDLIPNSDASYDRLGSIISDARLAGLVSWDHLEDRDRNLMGLSSYNSPQGMIRAKLNPEDYRRDLWADQPMRPEVWVEKKAMEDVVGQICSRLRVDFFACKGYVSQSEQYRAGLRLRDYVMRGQQPIVLHLGDHDPSGIDMTRDNGARLSMFAGTPVQVVRLALNMNQVERYRPPPNPAKKKDSRFLDYQRLYGDESWELDALNPPIIQSMIEENVMRLRDKAKWDEALRDESLERQELRDMIADMGGKDGPVT